MNRVVVYVSINGGDNVGIGTTDVIPQIDSQIFIGGKGYIVLSIVYDEVGKKYTFVMVKPITERDFSYIEILQKERVL